MVTFILVVNSQLTVQSEMNSKNLFIKQKLFSITFNDRLDDCMIGISVRQKKQCILVTALAKQNYYIPPNKVMYNVIRID